MSGYRLVKMVRCVLLRLLRPELDVIQNNCRVRFVGISRYVHFNVHMIRAIISQFLGFQSNYFGVLFSLLTFQFLSVVVIRIFDIISLFWAVIGYKILKKRICPISAKS
jgi:hypothetical protein